MRKLAFLLALVPGVAQAAQPACLTPAEFTALSTYALPNMITGAASRCATVLPKDAWLPANGTQLAGRYAEGKARAWPAAKAAFLKLGAGQGPDAARMLRTMPDPSLQLIADGFIQGLVGQKLPASRCAMVDRVVRLLSPLPAESTAELIAITVGLGARTGGGKVGDLALCPEVETIPAPAPANDRTRK